MASSKPGEPSDPTSFPEPSSYISGVGEYYAATIFLRRLVAHVWDIGGIPFAWVAGIRAEAVSAFSTLANRSNYHHLQRELVRLSGEYAITHEGYLPPCPGLQKLYVMCSSDVTPTFEQLYDLIPRGPTTKAETRTHRGSTLNDWWQDGEVREKCFREGTHKVISNMMQKPVSILSP